MKLRGRGTLFSYIRRLGSFFGFNILNFNIFGGFQKNEYFCGMKELWILFGSSHNWTIFRVLSNAFFGNFLRSMYRMGIFLGVAKISNIFGVLEIPDIFFFFGGGG